MLTYPVITMGELTHEGSKRNLLGDNPTQKEIDFASVEKHITAQSPAYFSWHSRSDATVDYRNSVLLGEACKKAGVNHQILLFDEGWHGMGAAEGTPQGVWMEKAVAFWENERLKK